MHGPRKMQSVLGKLESVRTDIEKTIDASQSRTHWRSLVRPVLIEWLGELFTDGEGHTNDLETALEIATTQVAHLKQVNLDLQDEVTILRAKHF